MIHVPSNVNNNIGTNKITFPQNFIMISCSLREQVVWNQPQVLGPNVDYNIIWTTVDAVGTKLQDQDMDLFFKHEHHCMNSAIVLSNIDPNITT